MSQARCRPHSSIRQANVRIVAIRWPVCQTPPRVVTHRIWVENPNRTVSHDAVDQPPDADPAEQPPAQADARRGQERVDHRTPPGRPSTAPDERHERHQGDRRERRERHVEPAADDDHVVRAGLEGQPGPAVEERVGEVEEVAAAGVEPAVAPASRRRPTTATTPRPTPASRGRTGASSRRRSRATALARPTDQDDDRASRQNAIG